MPPPDAKTPATPAPTPNAGAVLPCRECRCPPYDSVDRSHDVETFNCAGLAHRTYTFIGDVNAVKSMLARGRQINCTGQCNCCEIRHWLWEYDIHLEDADGNRLTENNRDFHTVAGMCDGSGRDPTNVYSKNGARPIIGPGTGPSFRPPARDQATSNDRNATPGVDSRKRPIYKVRTNMVETCYCLPCPS